jgi:hypothetical protein
MNVLVKTIGGGIFSTFVVAVQSILKQINELEKIDNIYIEFDKERSSNTKHNHHLNNNVYDFVLDQNINHINTVVYGIVYPDHIYQNLGDLLNTENLNKIRLIISKIKLKDKILNEINPEINVNTLGVHIRITDMIACHDNYMVNLRTKDSYVSKINQIISENSNIDKIFIASDNDILFLELKKEFPNIISNTVSNRFESIYDHSGSYVDYQYNQMSNERFWIDSFLEMYSLSKCGYLLYSTSNLSHTSLFFSKTINHIYKI